MDFKVSKVKNVSGEINVPADKSISHRAVMLASISLGKTRIENLLEGEDVLNTISCFNKMGIKIDRIKRGSYIIEGGKLQEPKNILYCGNSGTTMRLLMGILSAQPFYCVLSGDASLNKRPMKRVMEPLREMGGEFFARKDNFPPLTIIGKEKLKTVEYKMPVASAQVKSAIILASLFIEGETKILEKEKTRDHTEKMIKHFGGEIKIDDLLIKITGQQKLKGTEIKIPADISSAAFFIAAASVIKNSKIKILEVGVNPTRCGFIEIIKQMGAKVNLINERKFGEEEVADIEVEFGNLCGTEISGAIIPRVIDELPLIAVLATQAEGKTTICGARELRVKESDRIKTITTELKKMGAKIEEKEDGMEITGKTKLKGTHLSSYYDHRIAMSLAIAGMIAGGITTISNFECVNTSFPFFEKTLKKVVTM